ncbi:MAG: PD-(D/E)XK nuclease family protein, partial [Clostridia bacterium]|nr:PD-(D/E)XK nuclease family protein [Clostridia bacterium]
MRLAFAIIRISSTFICILPLKICNCLAAFHQLTVVLDNPLLFPTKTLTFTAVKTNAIFLMKTFLERVARAIIDTDGDQLDKVCVVMPNRRAGLFLRKHIATLAGRTVWSPDFYAVDDFYARISGFALADPVVVDFELYEIHRRIEKEKAQPFGEFIKWGHVLQTDFSDIDAHLVDARSIFGYLTEVKVIEKWNLTPDGLTAAVRDYLRFYSSLYEYYRQLADNLAATGSAWPGRMYRFAAENIIEIAEALPWKKIYFAGFNALTTAEEVVMKYLLTEGKATLLPDADHYYLDDPGQEAGIFLRKQMRIFGKQYFEASSNCFADAPPEKIQVHGVAGLSGQAVHAGTLLQQWLATQGASAAGQMAVVLADEQLMMPVLNALPENLPAFNVTMGYPLISTPQYSFLVYLLKMHENKKRFETTTKTASQGFHYNDVLRLLQHPLPAQVFDPASLVGAIRKSNQTFYSPNDVRSLMENLQPKDDQNSADMPTQLIRLVFGAIGDEPAKMLAVAGDIVNFFRNHYKNKSAKKQSADTDELQLEYLFNIALLLTRINDLNARYGTIDSIKSLREVFTAIARTQRLPFSGEPLRGAQVMGLLETRSLGFEKVILLGANEGKLPAAKSNDSYIPADIRAEYKLPTVTQKAAVYAYHFYRLLCGAQEVHILYNTNQDADSKEQSRFIRQIVHELPRYNPAIKIEEAIATAPPPSAGSDRILEVQKTESVMAQLTAKASRGLSPTSLNDYRKCSLRFYLKNIAGLKEPDEVQETIDHRIIGNMVHNVLEVLYTKIKGKRLITADISSLQPQVEIVMQEALLKEYQQGQVEWGRNKLLIEVIRKFIDDFLVSEIKLVTAQPEALQIVGLEQKVALDVEVASHGKMAKIHGVIDRIDLLNGMIRIIDYKTGNVSGASELRIKSWEDLWQGDKHDKVFQVLLYAWLYTRTGHHQGGDFEAGIISMRKLSLG